MSNSTLDSLSPDDKKKLQNCMDAGLRVMQEMADLRDGLKDTVKNIAEELNVKPAVLMKAVRVAFKQTMVSEKETVDTVEDILSVTGHA